MNTRLHLVVAAAAGALVVSGCSTTDESEATPVVANEAAEAAADWVVANLNDEDLLEITTSYEGETTSTVDHGNSADLALGLSAIDYSPEQASAITDAVAADLVTYVGDKGEVYAGPSAKALTLALDQGRDPHDFGGVDLQARVEETVSTQQRIAGRIRDTSQWGDYANTLGQAYAAGALARAESDRAETATDFLLAQQCSEGFFRLDLADPKATEQGCDADDSLDPEQGPDVTALVVLQLARTDHEDPDVGAALDSAKAWLQERQNDDGSFTDPMNGTNANSTGVAGSALRVLGEDEAADLAGAWLSELQIPDNEGGLLAAEAGAVAYDSAALADGREFGIADPLDRSQWVIAGVQALPGLAEVLDSRS